MATYPHILFIIPGLFQPLKLWQKDFAFRPEAASLLALCANANFETLPVSGLESTLFYWLGHPAENEIPFAWYRYQQDFGSTPSQPLLCADPVFLQSGIDQVILHPATPQLTGPEARELLVSLNAHLAEDGLQLVAQHPQRWYLLGQGDQHEPLPERTTPLSEAKGQSVFPRLPQGNRAYWHRLLNELQMLLHGSGNAKVNALWLWGASSPDSIARLNQADWTIPATTMNAETIILAGQARVSKASAFVELEPAGRHLVILEDLLLPSLSDDMQDWQQAVTQLETNWLAPALEAFRRGRCSISLSACDGRILHCQSPSRWKFWRNPPATWEQLI